MRVEATERYLIFFSSSSTTKIADKLRYTNSFVFLGDRRLVLATASTQRGVKL
jgi:hypothetical protein